MKTQLTLIAAALIILPAQAQAPVWAAGLIAGMSSIVSAAKIIIDLAGDYESMAINTVPNTYHREQYVTLKVGGQNYRDVWDIGETMGGYAYKHTRDGSGLTALTETTPFIIGGDLPMAATQYTCEGATFKMTVSSSMGFKSSYVITKPAMYHWAAPQGVYFTTRLAGTVLNTTCSYIPLTFTSDYVQKYVPRLQSVRWNLEKKNMSVDDWSSVVN